MDEYIDSEMEVELTKLNQIFEHFIPPESDLGKAVKYYGWEHKEPNDLIFGLFLGLLEFHLAFSLEKNRGEEIDYILLLKFQDCCDKLDVINEEKKQLRAFWFWKMQKEIPLVFNVSGASDVFVVLFENSASPINKLKFSPLDLLNLSNEVINISTEDKNYLHPTTYVFRHPFDWISYLTVSPLEQEIFIVVERNGEKLSLLKLSNCQDLRIYDKEKKILEIFAGNHSDPNIHCFVDLSKVPYVWIEIGYPVGKPSSYFCNY